MRLIDAHGSYTVNANDNTGYSLAFGGGIISVVDEFGHIVAEFDADDTPTIEAEPVKYGRWVTAGVGITERTVCSNCRSSRGSYLRPPFCNQCGAKMDGGAGHAGADG